MTKVSSFPKQDRCYDGMVFSSQKNMLICKTSKGKIIYWKKSEDNSTWIEISKWHLCHLYNTSTFSISYDGEYICFGDDNGLLYIYKIDTFQQIRQLEHLQANFATSMCAFGPGNSIFQIGNSPYLLWWKHVDPMLIEKYNSKCDENEKVISDEESTISKK